MKPDSEPGRDADLRIAVIVFAVVEAIAILSVVLYKLLA